MKESRYNFWFKTNDNMKAVYNTFTQALVLLDDIDIDCIHNLKMLILIKVGTVDRG